MPWVQIQKSTEVTWADYERVQQEVGEEPPPGLLYHVAGEVDGGRWQSVSVWRSEGDFNRFREERLLPAVERVLGASMAGAAPPPAEAFEAKHVLSP